MLLTTVIRDSVTTAVPATVLASALGEPTLKSALINLAASAIIHLTQRLFQKHKARRAARKAAAANV